MYLSSNGELVKDRGPNEWLAAALHTIAHQERLSNDAVPSLDASQSDSLVVPACRMRILRYQHSPPTAGAVFVGTTNRGRTAASRPTTWNLLFS